MPGWHWHEGRPRYYNDADRRKYAELKREERSQKWHEKWISRSTLKDHRNWTDGAIKRFLPEPKQAGPIKAWLKTDVENAEQANEFLIWMAERKQKQAMANLKKQQREES